MWKLLQLVLIARVNSYSSFLPCGSLYVFAAQASHVQVMRPKASGYLNNNQKFNCDVTE